MRRGPGERLAASSRLGRLRADDRLLASSRLGRLRADDRLLAWLYTGPLGHLWSALADLASYAARRLARRDP